jgi:hypothetical protein
MVRVGNWSRLQQAPWQLAEARARMNQQRAELARTQAQGRLLKTVGQAGAFQRLALPAGAPALDPTALDEAQLQTRAQALRAQLPPAEALASRDSVHQAYAAYRAAHAVALAAQDTLALSSFVAEETVLHYNGMLKSTWDVLGETQNQLQAQQDANNARRDFETARIDLEWVLMGGQPTDFVRLGGADAAPAAAGH